MRLGAEMDGFRGLNGWVWELCYIELFFPNFLNWNVPLQNIVNELV